MRAQVLALGKPTVLALVHGGAMSLGPLKATAPAILDCFYGGDIRPGRQSLSDTALYISFVILYTNIQDGVRMTLRSAARRDGLAGSPRR